MKVILCTGDSHTVGQGSDSIRTMHKPKSTVPYNTAGKGIARGGDLDTPSYVNLLRSYVAQHTGSEYAITNGHAIRAQTGCPVVDQAAKLQGRYTLPKGWQLHTVCVAESTEPAQLDVYIDGQLIRRELLHTALPRYGDWSFRNLSFPCKPEQEVVLVPAAGDVYISHVQHDKGRYAVINSGVGSCTSKRYLEECFGCCVEECKPAIIVAEAHTINDWLNYQSSGEHGEHLNKLLDCMKAIGADVVFSTVAPIKGNLVCPKSDQHYDDFMAQSKKVAQREDLLFADSNAAFAGQLAGLTPEEISAQFYVDHWHVNGRGHKIYADTIFDVLKTLL